jgi:hypothetical protein
MIVLSWELAGCMLLFQVLQALAIGLVIALLLWLEKRRHARRIPNAGDTA